ncbi:MAG TPA: hypothetical protein PKD68_04595 [Candidatus Saccharibacteria bacterium]|nr:hypothetical protein [Candidatus Saccharibacteria bacterium]
MSKPGKKVSIPLPVYLDYQAVFDTLAILDDGLSQFQEVKTVYSDLNEKNNDVNVNADVKGKIPLGFLSMGGEGAYRHGSTKQNTNSHEVSQQKIHTSVSLFAKTRERLDHEGLIKNIDDTQLLSAGDFIEFQAKFEKFELVQVLDLLAKSVEVGNKFTDAKGKAKTKLPSEMVAMRDTIAPFANNSLVYKVGEDSRYVVELSGDLLPDHGIEPLLRGEYKVLGKIVRIERNGYNIFESTDLAVFKPTALKDLLDDAFQQVVVKGGDVEKMFAVPEQVPMQFGGLVVIVKPMAVFI